MRRIVLAMMIAGSVQAAQAADFPDLPILRGSLREGLTPVRTARWQGFYIGGQAGTGASDMNFAGATQDMVAKLLVNTAIENSGGVSDWPVMGKKSQRGNGFGGFAGYNAQWDDVVLGLEASYMHGDFGGNDSGTMSRVFTAGGNTNFVTYDATSRFQIKDMGSVRARAGYAWGNFLPYAFGGVSLGRADVLRSATVSGTQVPIVPGPSIPFSLSASEGQSNRFIYGYAAGLGVDMMLFSNLFVRAEWEYLKFSGPIDTSINTVRGGVGYRF